ncbi:MFS transporter [soil metagenome]
MTTTHPVRIAATALFPFACGYFLSYLLRAVNAVVAPDLVAAFGLTPGELGLLTSAYLIAFSLFQLPLGVLLDRYGPRRVQSVLLLVAASGCVLFAAAPGFVSLFLARAVIGFGFAGGLMAGLKAISLWVPVARRPLANTLIMSMGALGIIVATEPTQILSMAVGWRTSFLIFAALIALCAAYIFFAVPERQSAPSTVGFTTQVREFAHIFRLPVVWHLVPLLAVTAGTQVAIQTLWAGPWLRDVMGLSRDEAARYLLWMAVAFMIGILSAGIVADRLGRRGISPLAVMLGYHLIYLAAQTVIVFRLVTFALPAWLIVAAFGQVAIIAYPWLASRVGAEFAGRSNAAINFSMFVVAFIAQYAIGLIIGLFPASSTGYDPAAYSWAFGAFLILQIAALLWYLASAARTLTEPLYDQSPAR